MANDTHSKELARVKSKASKELDRAITAHKQELAAVRKELTGKIKQLHKDAKAKMGMSMEASGRAASSLETRYLGGSLCLAVPRFLIHM